MSDERVAALLADIHQLDPARHALVQALRELVRSLAPAIVEEVKYGGLLFSCGQPCCGIFSYRHHAALEFGAGALLPDAYGVLEGEGKFRRHIKLQNVDDIAARHVRNYLVLALAAAR